MFPDADSNSFTVPCSDQFLLYNSNLLDYADIDDYNHNPYSPFSFFDQNITHPIFFPSDEQLVVLQNSPLDQLHGEQQQPMLTAFVDFTMADTSSNNCTSIGAGFYSTENFHHNVVFRSDPPANGISRSEDERMKIDKVSKNVNLSKKDRHSKINTAQGPRDRRMRLSLDIARRFFGLQDMLGFDKASKTVDWLLSKSESEIKKVAKIRETSCDGNNVATKSDSFGACERCEEGSGVVYKEYNNVSQSGMIDTNKMDKKSSSKKKKISTGKVSMSSVRNGFNNLSKDSRGKARARARERTKEKMMICTMQKLNKLDENNDHFSNMDQNMLFHQVKKPEFLNPGCHAYLYADQGHTQTNKEDEYVVNTLHWNPCSCNYHSLQQRVSETSHQVPFEDIQLHAKPWETYN